MRPQSEVRVDVAAALLDGPGTVKQLAQRTGWSIGKVRTALDNMVRAGDAREVARVRVPGVKQTVPVYGRAVRVADVIAVGHQAVAQVLGGWMRWPSYAQPASMGAPL
jgi:hypothetical protein